MTAQHLHSELIERIRENCLLSDALYARDYSLCIYLLKMRELYRWEQGIALGEPLPKRPLGEWITAREAYWESIEEAQLRSLEVAGEQFSPFDGEALNERLGPAGLVYSGGYCGSKPHFFLAELEQKLSLGETTVYICGHELARELTAPPAMSQGNVVFLRRESLQRMIWEMLEEWGWQDPNRAIARAAAHHNLSTGKPQGLEEMASQELDTLLQHELGEVAVGRELGPRWEAMLAALPRSRTEFQLRAIRDHLVDCRYTLPWLLDEGRDASIHFYFANFTTMRKALFPSLYDAYRQWLEHGSTVPLRELCKHAEEHWARLAEQALEAFAESDNPALFQLPDDDARPLAL